MGNSNSVDEFESNNKAERNQGFIVPDSAVPASPRRLESFQLDKRFENHVGLPVAVDGYGGGILRFYGRHKLPPHILCGIAMHVPAVEIATGNQPGIVYLNHKNPTAILCDPQKVTLITDDPFLEQNNITRWSDENKNARPIDPYAQGGFAKQGSSGSVRADPMLDAQDAQRQRGEDLKRRQEAERRVKMEEAEKLRQRQMQQDQVRQQQQQAAQAQQQAQQAREEERRRQEEERRKQEAAKQEAMRLQRENEAKLRKQREEEERIALSQAAERRLQEAQKRREAALAAGENAANSEAAIKAAEAENARILAEAAASRKAAEEMERTMEAEEKKRIAALEQAERDRIANEAKQRRANAEQEAAQRAAQDEEAAMARRAAQDNESEEARRQRIEYAARPDIHNSDEWWSSEEGQRQRDLDTRKAERQASSNGPRKATLFDLNSMGTKPETPRALSKGQFSMLNAPERKSGFDVVKRARPEMAVEANIEEEGHDECTFLGNCKCANCR